MPRDIVFNRYRITRKLSDAGGMAVLWLGEDQVDHKKVAIKQLRSELLSEADCQEWIDRFSNEANVHLPSEHVVQGYQFGQEGSDYFYVMEFVDGKDLSNIIHPQNGDAVDTGTPLPEARALPIIDQTAEALECAHAHNIIHRDIKPANILLTATDFVKLSDFGIACFTTQARKTTFGSQMGSPFWESPEQIIEPRDADARSDIWSLGVMAYECLSGSVPFFDTFASALTLKVMKEAPPDLVKRTGGKVSSAMQQVVFRCLEKDPAKRFQSMTELRIALPITRSTPLTVGLQCPACATPLPKDARFCGKCGLRLVGNGVGKLIITQGVKANTEFPLTREVMHLGRIENECEVLLDTDHYVSRRHASIMLERGAYKLVDGNWNTGDPSTNGTFVNGNQIKAAEPLWLHPGDNIRVGDTFLTFEIQ